MAEALRTGNPDLVTEAELLEQIPASVNGRQSVAFDLVPDDVSVTWLLDPSSGFVRDQGTLDILLQGTRNAVQSSSPANKTLAVIGSAIDAPARLAYYGGNPFVTNDGGTTSYRPVSDAGLISVIQNSVRFLVPEDACNTTAQALQRRQEMPFADVRIVLAQAENGRSETATLPALRSVLPGATINGGSTVANTCDFVAGQENPCLAGANLLIVGDDASRGDDTIAQQVATAHLSGIALLVMTEDGNPQPLSKNIMQRLGVDIAQNYFNGRTVIEQATKEDLVPQQIISDQLGADALTMAQYLGPDPLVPGDYSACLGTVPGNLGDVDLQQCIEAPMNGVTAHARPYFAALTRLRKVFDDLSVAGTDLFVANFGSRTEIIRVLALLADKFRRGPGNQPDDAAIAISYPVELRDDGAAAGRSFYADWVTTRTTNATGRPLSLGSIWCPTRTIAENNLASCQAPRFPDVGDYPLTLRSAPEDRFTATGLDQMPGNPAIVTLQTDPGFTVYVRTLATKDYNGRALGLTSAGGSTYSRAQFAVGPFIRLQPNVPITVNGPYGGPLYVRLDAPETSDPTNVQLNFANVAKHPVLAYPANDADIARFVDELAVSTAYWADIVGDVFEIHSPVARFMTSLGPAGKSVEAGPGRNVFYNGSNGLTDLINDFRDSWAGEIYRLAGLRVRREPLSSTVSAELQTVCADLQIPCLNATINTRVAHQHVTYEAFSACGGLCSGNPITISGDPNPLGYGEGHELGHNLQRFQLGIFWPDTAAGSQIGKLNSWSSYVRRDQEVSNNIFPINNIYTYFRYTLPARRGTLPDDGPIRSHDPRNYLDSFSAHASAYSNLQLNGRQVVLDALCRTIRSFPIGTRPDVQLADAIWSDGAYAANTGTRLSFYVPLPDLLQGRPLANGVAFTDGRDIFTLLYQSARAFTVYADTAETWAANRNTLGFSLYEYTDSAVYGSGVTVDRMIGNDFLLVVLCYLTGYDFRPYFASRGVFYTALANSQVDANALASASGSLKFFGKPHLALNTQQPQLNRTSLPVGAPGAYVSSDVFVDSTNASALWPGSDDNRDGTPESYAGFHPAQCAGVIVGS